MYRKQKLMKLWLEMCLFVRQWPRRANIFGHIFAHNSVISTMIESIVVRTSLNQCKDLIPILIKIDESDPDAGVTSLNQFKEMQMRLG